MLTPWERVMSREFLRKASKDLMPSESPFFSPKALSSSPWSAKPFMRIPYAHRAFSVSRIAYRSAFNELKNIISKMTARLFFDIGAQPYEHRGTRPSRNLGVIPTLSKAHLQCDLDIIFRALFSQLTEALYF